MHSCWQYFGHVINRLLHNFVIEQVCTHNKIFSKGFFKKLERKCDTYFDSLSRIHDLITIYDEVLDKIMECSTAKESNEAILCLVILLKASDDKLLEFCSIMEAVIEDKQKVAEVVEPLRNGLYINIDSYTDCT